MKKIKELVSSAKSGNKKSFDKLYELTHNDVWYNCLSLLKDEENAKDIMQETYITAFLKLDTLKDEEKFCGWVTTIAVNLCKKKLKGKVEYQIDDEVLITEAETDELMLPEEYITKTEKRKVLLQIMEDTLSFNQYQTVLMFYFDEMSISEIAQGFEISEGTVKSRLNSSRAKMKTAIEDYEKKAVTSFTALLLYLSLQLFSRKKQRALQYRTLQSSSRTDRHLQPLQQKALQQVQSQQCHLS